MMSQNIQLQRADEHYLLTADIHLQMVSESLSDDG
jgi:hypothetical protein